MGKRTFGLGCIVFVIVIAILLFLPSCIFAPHLPPPNPDDLWVSDEPNIWFVGFDEEKGGPIGQMVSDGEVIDVMMWWGPGPRFDISRYPNEGPDDWLVQGDCNFSQDKGIVTVTEDIGNVLGGAKTITFERKQRQGDGSSVLTESEKGDDISENSDMNK